MNPRLQRRIQRYGWDKAAHHYEPYWKQQLAPAQQRLLAAAALQPGEHVLDVACGTGLVTVPAAEAVGPHGQVMGVDLSDEMVAAVRARAGRRGLGHVRTLQMDAEALRLPSAHFDAALCALGLMYVPGPVQALREMRRVIRPGGRAAAVVWGRRTHCGWQGIFGVVDARVKTDVCPLFFQLGTGEALRLAFEAAGFEAVTTERFATPLHYDSAEAACMAAFAGGPVAMAYARFDDPTRADAHAEYLASIEPYRTGTAYAIPGEFVVASGRR